MAVLIFCVMGYFVLGATCVAWCGQRGPLLESETEKVVVFALWPLWFMAHLAYRYGRKGR